VTGFAMDELLFRHLHPSWIDNGVITSQLFKPTKKDAGCVSTERSSKISPEGAYAGHLALGFESVGVYAVSVDEVRTGVNLEPVDDPRDDEGKPAHAFIDMRELDNKAIRGAAGLLRDRAVTRGCLHPAP